MSRTPARPNRLPRALRARRAFTLIEVMIVVVILAILATVAAPSLVNATAPLPETIAGTLEIDMRRARVEAIGRIKPVVLMVGANRDRWWLAEADSPDTAIEGTVRLFGSGTLGGYTGFALWVEIDGTPAAAGNLVFARFDAVGSRDETTISLGLVAPLATTPVANWTLAPQRTKFESGG